MVAMMNQDAPYSGIAGLMAAKGRYGDTELLHVRPDELAGLASVGQLTINPDTGLPEAFSFKSLLPAIGAIAGSVLLGPGIGTALGKGAFAAAAGAGLGAGIGGFTGGLAAGQSPTEALIGGLVSGATSGIMAGIMGPSPTELAAGLKEAGTATQQTIGQPITEAGLKVGKFASPESLLRPELTATPPINVGQVLSPSGSYIPGSLQSLVSPELTVTPAINAAQVLSPSGSYIPGSLLDPAIGSPVPVASTAPPAASALPALPAPPAASDTVSKLVKVEGDLAKELGSTSIGDSVKDGLNPGEQVVTVGGIKTLPYVQKALGAGNELTTGEIARALLQRPSTYTPLAFGVVEGMMAPPEFDPSQDEGLAALESTYTPRDLRVTGGEFTQGDLSQEDYTRLALEGGLQSPLTPFRYEEEDTVTLAEGGTPEAKEVDTQVEEDTVASEEKRKEEEILQKRKAASEVDKFISNTVGGAALGALIQGGLNQDPAATATPYGQGAQPINTGGNFGFNQGGLVGLSNGGSTSTGSKKKSTDSINIPISLQATMKRLGVEDPTPFLEFAQKTKQIESSGGVNRINPNSSARGDFQWLTKVNPKAKKGVHGSVKTAVNRTIASYKKVGQEIPEWLKTLDSNSTKSTKDLEKNILSLTPNQELELFFGNMNYAKDSDKYLKKIAKGDKEAMYGAYSDIHHTRGREDKPTQQVAIKTFYSDMPDLTGPVSMSKENEEGLMSLNSNSPYLTDPVSMSKENFYIDSPNLTDPVSMSKENEEGLMSLIRSYLPNFLTRAEGGQIQPYFEGKVIGPGDGQSDQVLFDVEGNDPDMALLSPDEYVIPADAVAMIGSGSSNAGAKKLDGFVKNIRKKATGKTKQQKPIKQGLESFLA